VADDYTRLCKVLFKVNEIDRAAERLDKALALAEPLAREHPEDASHQNRLAVCLHYWGVMQIFKGDAARAEQAWQRARDLLRPVAAASPEYRMMLAKLHMVLGNLHGQRGQFAPMEEDFGAAQALGESLVNEDPANRAYRFTLAEIRRMGPVIRRGVRVHFLVPRDPLRRLFDSDDICQSVFIELARKLTADRFEYLTPQEFPKLLLKMAGDKVCDKRRAANALARDHRRERGGKVVENLTTEEDAARLVAEKDLAEQVARHLKRRERAVAVLWAAGHTWEEAARRGDPPLTPSGARMLLGRAFRRAARALPQGHGEELDALYLRAVYRRVARRLAREED
jgi:tetratricopeptide (TPR) repeat protein